MTMPAEYAQEPFDNSGSTYPVDTGLEAIMENHLDPVPGSNGVCLEPFTKHPGEHAILLPRGGIFMIDGFGQLPDSSPLVYLRMV